MKYKPNKMKLINREKNENDNTSESISKSAVFNDDSDEIDFKTEINTIKMRQTKQRRRSSQTIDIKSKQLKAGQGFVV